MDENIINMNNKNISDWLSIINTVKEGGRRVYIITKYKNIHSDNIELMIHKDRDSGNVLLENAHNIDGLSDGEYKDDCSNCNEFNSFLKDKFITRIECCCFLITVDDVKSINEFSRRMDDIVKSMQYIEKIIISKPTFSKGN